MFGNVGISNSHVGELQRRKHTTYRTRRKFEIKNRITRGEKNPDAMPLPTTNHHMDWNGNETGTPRRVVKALITVRQLQGVSAKDQQQIRCICK
jgi:hypothetical protein